MIQIIGAGGFGRELAAYCEAHSIPVFQFANHNQPGIVNGRDAVIAIGDEEVRRQIVDEKELQSWGIINFAHQYGKCEIGIGSIICPHTILTTNVTLGSHCLININCTIGHDVFIGDFVTVNPGVNISGNVRIGGNCNIGSNSVIRNGITICDDVIIGAGSVVVKDITEPGTYVGSPAIRIDKRPKYMTHEDVSKYILSLEKCVSVNKK
jgi:sugar O-acyltransferase (sialic acid O-acetyltransferase NeuD family)